MKRYTTLSLLAVLFSATAAHAQINPDVLADPHAPLSKQEDILKYPHAIHKVYDPTLGRIVDADARRAANLARLQKAEAMYQQAEEFRKKKQIAKAIPLYVKSVEIDENHLFSRLRLADIYFQRRRSADVLDILRPVVVPPPNQIYGGDIRTRMKYVLALLDTGKWEEAAAIYEKSIQSDTLHWSLPNYCVALGNKEHELPVLHFSPALRDEPGLRTRAHLILAIRPPDNEDIFDAAGPRAYRLEQLDQALLTDRNCLDAHFLRALVLEDMGRFEEAQAAFGRAAKLAPREAQPEIKAALSKLKEREDNKKLLDAQKAAKLVSDKQAATR